MSLTDEQIITLAKQYWYSNNDFYYTHEWRRDTDGQVKGFPMEPPLLSPHGRQLIDLARAAYEANERERDDDRLIRN